MSLFRGFFITLPNSTYLNEMAKKIEPIMGVNRVVAGNIIEQLIDTIGCLDTKYIDVTVDNLGGFVNNKAVVIQAKNGVLETMEAVNKYQVNAHMSVKVGSLDGESDAKLAYQNLREILLKANTYSNMHISIDMRKYNSLSQALQILDRLKGEFRDVDTVTQGYLFEAEKLIDKYPELRPRLVKGAYEESDTIAHQSKRDVDKNYINIIEKRLLNAKNSTSIATHDDNIISHAKQFVKDHHTGKNAFEFQMLYGFRNGLAEEITKRGYHFTVYVPYGSDWFAYFMRRLAERPRNLSLAYQEFISTEALRKIGLVSGLTLGTLALVFSIVKLLKR